MPESPTNVPAEKGHTKDPDYRESSIQVEGEAWAESTAAIEEESEGLEGEGEE